MGKHMTSYKNKKTTKEGTGNSALQINCSVCSK